MNVLIGSRLIKRLELGIGNALYGGRMLEWLAEHGALYSMKVTGESHLVGYRFGDVVLSRPVREGDILDFYGGVPQFGTTSVTFPVTAKVGEETALTAVCTFVAVDENGLKKQLEVKKNVLPHRSDR